MKKCCFWICLFCCLMPFVRIAAQSGSSQVVRGGAAPLAGQLNLSDTSIQDWAPHLQNISEQNDGLKEFGPNKGIVNERRRQYEQQKHANGSSSPRGSLPPKPVMLTNFTANNAQGTPNDNHIAVSNAGKIVSVVNTNIKVFSDSGTVLQTKSLAYFANSLGLLIAISDPRVLYDPVADRFIVVFFTGSSSPSTQIILGFSQTNDPTQQWNLYELKGNYLSDSTWSDYPVVSLSDKDLFMTFNQLQDGHDWKNGFQYSVIWQIDKQRGYDGDSLLFNYWHHIDYNGKSVWNICPVRGGAGLSGPDTYFLSVRPSALSNDTVFLHRISDSYQSGQAQLSTQVLTTNTNYGIAPDAKQRDGQYLATNDARVLDAFEANDKIQYVLNTVTPSFTSGVYVGEIDHPDSPNPTASGQIIANDTIDFGYPSIAYMGNNNFDNRAFITCSYSAPDTFPGTVAFYKDASGNISDMLLIKPGERAEDVMLDTVERWGDYTGIQRKYNEPNVAWIAGSYVAPTHAYRTWIAQLINSDSSAVISSLTSPPADFSAQIFPNPASDVFTLKFHADESGPTDFSLYDINGRLVRDLLHDQLNEGANLFSFNTQYLSDGIYFLRINTAGQSPRSEKIVIRR